MYRIVFLFSLLPSYALSTSFGSVPIRYFPLFCLFFVGSVKKELLLFVLLALLHAIYMIFGLFVWRSFHLIDLSYILAYLFCFQFCYMAYRYPNKFDDFINLFFWLNIFYATMQNIALNFGVESKVLMLHQNTHVNDYIIPGSYIPYFFRVTGLFVESVPFVAYLMATLIYFDDRRYLLSKSVCLLFILLSGAKLGLVFLVLYFFLVFMRDYIAIYKLFPFFLLLAFTLFPQVHLFLKSMKNDELLYSISYRYDTLISTLNDFISETSGFLFGRGFISSYELMTRDDLQVIRGNGFISMYIYSNGVFGSLILLSPLCLFIFYLSRSLPVKVLNISFVVFLLFLISIGTFTVFNYAYLAVVICLLSWRRDGAISHYRRL